MATDAHHDGSSAAVWRTGSRTRGGRGRIAQLDSALRGSVDAGLAALVFAVPLILGGRTALGQLVLVGLTLWVAVCCCLRGCLASRSTWIRSGAEPLMLATLVLVGLQLVALPPSLLKVLSPHVYETLPLSTPGADASASLGVWTTLSFTPAATRSALVLLLAFGLLFLVTLQRVRQVEDIQRILRWIAVATLVMVTFGLVQYLTSNGKYFWFFEYPRADTKKHIVGGFTNRNHFAHFVALGVGPLIWWLLDGLRRGDGRKPAWQISLGRDSAGLDVTTGLRAIALGLAVFVGLLSLSRGGAMSVCVALVVSSIILYRASLIGRKSLGALVGVVLLVGTSLAIYGYSSVSSRLDDFGSLEDLDRSQTRRRLWQADLAAIGSFPLTGTGLGSHAEVCPKYLPNVRSSQRIDFTHAENGYIQVCLEAGIPGLLLALTAIGFCIYWCVSSAVRGTSARFFLVLAAVAPALAASFAHSAVDFVWYVPGCMVVVVMLAACACRLRQMGCDREDKPARASTVPRVAWLAVLACLVPLGYFMLQDRLAAARAEPDWYRYLRLSKSLPDREGADRYSTLRCIAEKLSAVVERQPGHARAHARLADVRLKLFDQPQDANVASLDAGQVREAALASGFQSSQALGEWLSRAFGRRCEHLTAARWHARRAVALCPLQGEAYLYLAKLSFLEGPNSPPAGAYIEQALRVRPFDGAVLFAAGQEAALAGDLPQAVEYWRASFQAGDVHQERLLKHLAPRVPAAFVLQAFQPDLPALQRIAKHYRRAERTEDARFVLRQYAQASKREAGAMRGETAAENWRNAARAYQQLDGIPDAVECLRNVIRCDPSDYNAHYALGKSLHRLKRFEEAEEHLTWCLRRKPEDKQLRALLEAAVDGRLRLGNRSAEPSGTTTH